MKEQNENNQNKGEAGNFGLPKDYFQKSAAEIMNRIEWQEEHKDFAVLSSLKESNPFLVPGNYFFKNEISLELVEYSTLKELKKENPFVVPQNYFEEAQTFELAKVLKGDRDGFFPGFQSLDKQNRFKTPENYFVKNKADLTAKINPAKKTKVISLFSKRIGFAAAALVVVTLGIWLYNFYFAFTPVVPEDCGTIACLDKQDVVKSKSLERLDEEELYDLVDPSVLEKKLQQTKTEANPKEKKDQHSSDLDKEDLLDEL